MTSWMNTSDPMLADIANGVDTATNEKILFQAASWNKVLIQVLHSLLQHLQILHTTTPSSKPTRNYCKMFQHW